MYYQSYILITFFLLFTLTKSFGFDSQNPTDTIFTDGSDIHGIKVVVKEKVAAGKGYCIEINPKSRGALYRVNIETILFSRDTSVFKNDTMLSNIKYVLIDLAIAKLIVGQTYLLTCYNSSNTDYLVANRVFDDKREIYFDINKYLIYRSGLIQCWKLTLLQKISYPFYKRKEKIIKKAKQRQNCENYFWRVIHHVNKC